MDDAKELYITHIAKRLRSFTIEMIRAVYMVVEEMDKLRKALINKGG